MKPAFKPWTIEQGRWTALIPGIISFLWITLVTNYIGFVANAEAFTSLETSAPVSSSTTQGAHEKTNSSNAYSRTLESNFITYHTTLSQFGSTSSYLLMNEPVSSPAIKRTSSTVRSLDTSSRQSAFRTLLSKTISKTLVSNLNSVSKSTPLSFVPRRSQLANTLTSKLPSVTQSLVLSDNQFYGGYPSDTKLQTQNVLSSPNFTDSILPSRDQKTQLSGTSRGPFQDPSRYPTSSNSTSRSKNFYSKTVLTYSSESVLLSNNVFHAGFESNSHSPKEKRYLSTPTTQEVSSSLSLTKSDLASTDITTLLQRVSRSSITSPPVIITTYMSESRSVSSAVLISPSLSSFLSKSASSSFPASHSKSPILFSSVMPSRKKSEVLSEDLLHTGFVSKSNLPSVNPLYSTSKSRKVLSSSSLTGSVLASVDRSSSLSEINSAIGTRSSLASGLESGSKSKIVSHVVLSSGLSESKTPSTSVKESVLRTVFTSRSGSLSDFISPSLSSLQKPSESGSISGSQVSPLSVRSESSTSGNVSVSVDGSTFLPSSKLLNESTSYSLRSSAFVSPSPLVSSSRSVLSSGVLYLSNAVSGISSLSSRDLSSRYQSASQSSVASPTVVITTSKSESRLVSRAVLISPSMSSSLSKSTLLSFVAKEFKSGILSSSVLTSSSESIALSESLFHSGFVSKSNLSSVKPFYSTSKSQEILSSSRLTGSVLASVATRASLSELNSATVTRSSLASGLESDSKSTIVSHVVLSSGLSESKTPSASVKESVLRTVFTSQSGSLSDFISLSLSSLQKPSESGSISVSQVSPLSVRSESSTSVNVSVSANGRTSLPSPKLLRESTSYTLESSAFVSPSPLISSSRSVLSSGVLYSSTAASGISSLSSRDLSSRYQSASQSSVASPTVVITTSESESRLVSRAVLISPSVSSSLSKSSLSSFVAKESVLRTVFTSRSGSLSDFISPSLSSLQKPSESGSISISQVSPLSVRSESSTSANVSVSVDGSRSLPSPKLLSESTSYSLRSSAFVSRSPLISSSRSVLSGGVLYLSNAVSGISSLSSRDLSSRYQSASQSPVASPTVVITTSERESRLVSRAVLISPSVSSSLSKSSLSSFVAKESKSGILSSNVLPSSSKSIVLSESLFHSGFVSESNLPSVKPFSSTSKSQEMLPSSSLTGSVLASVATRASLSELNSAIVTRSSLASGLESDSKSTIVSHVVLSSGLSESKTPSASVKESVLRTVFTSRSGSLSDFISPSLSSLQKPSESGSISGSRVSPLSVRSESHTSANVSVSVDGSTSLPSPKLLSESTSYSLRSSAFVSPSPLVSSSRSVLSSGVLYSSNAVSGISSLSRRDLSSRYQSASQSPVASPTVVITTSERESRLVSRAVLISPSVSSSLSKSSLSSFVAKESKSGILSSNVLPSSSKSIVLSESLFHSGFVSESNLPSVKPFSSTSKSQEMLSSSSLTGSVLASVATRASLSELNSAIVTRSSLASGFESDSTESIIFSHGVLSSSLSESKTPSTSVKESVLRTVFTSRSGSLSDFISPSLSSLQKPLESGSISCSRVSPLSVRSESHTSANVSVSVDGSTSLPSPKLLSESTSYSLRSSAFVSPSPLVSSSRSVLSSGVLYSSNPVSGISFSRPRLFSSRSPSENGLFSFVEVSTVTSKPTGGLPSIVTFSSFLLSVFSRRSASAPLREEASFVYGTIGTDFSSKSRDMVTFDHSEPVATFGSRFTDPLNSLALSFTSGILSVDDGDSSMPSLSADMSSITRATSSSLSSSVIRECFASACREDQICLDRNGFSEGNVKSYECRCRPGFFEAGDSNQCERVDVLESNLIISGGNFSRFTSALADKESKEFQDLASKVVTAVNNVYESSELAAIYKGSEVIRFSNGSVIADLLLYFNSTINGTIEEAAEKVMSETLNEQNNTAIFEGLFLDPTSFVVADRDECRYPDSNDCDSNANCNNTIGSFECFCTSGYTGDGRTCTDVDECRNSTLNDCSALYPGFVCINIPGGYRCISASVFPSSSLYSHTSQPAAATKPVLSSVSDSALKSLGVGLTVTTSRHGNVSTRSFSNLSPTVTTASSYSGRHLLLPSPPPSAIASDSEFSSTRQIALLSTSFPHNTSVLVLATSSPMTNIFTPSSSADTIVTSNLLPSSIPHLTSSSLVTASQSVSHAIIVSNTLPLDLSESSSKSVSPTYSQLPPSTISPSPASVSASPKLSSSRPSISTFKSVYSSQSLPTTGTVNISSSLLYTVSNTSSSSSGFLLLASSLNLSTSLFSAVVLSESTRTLISLRASHSVTFSILPSEYPSTITSESLVIRPSLTSISSGSVLLSASQTVVLSSSTLEDDSRSAPQSSIPNNVLSNSSLVRSAISTDSNLGSLSVTSKPFASHSPLVSALQIGSQSRVISESISSDVSESDSSLARSSELSFFSGSASDSSSMSHVGSISLISSMGAFESSSMSVNSYVSISQSVDSRKSLSIGESSAASGSINFPTSSFGRSLLYSNPGISSSSISFLALSTSLNRRESLRSALLVTSKSASKLLHSSQLITYFTSLSQESSMISSAFVTSSIPIFGSLSVFTRSFESRSTLASGSPIEVPSSVISESISSNVFKSDFSNISRVGSLSAFTSGSLFRSSSTSNITYVSSSRSVNFSKSRSITESSAALESINVSISSLVSSTLYSSSAVSSSSIGFLPLSTSLNQRESLFSSALSVTSKGASRSPRTSQQITGSTPVSESSSMISSAALSPAVWSSLSTSGFQSLVVSPTLPSFLSHIGPPSISKSVLFRASLFYSGSVSASHPSSRSHVFSKSSTSELISRSLSPVKSAVSRDLVDGAISINSSSSVLRSLATEYQMSSQSSIISEIKSSGKTESESESPSVISIYEAVGVSTIDASSMSQFVSSSAPLSRTSLERSSISATDEISSPSVFSGSSFVRLSESESRSARGIVFSSSRVLPSSSRIISSSLEAHPFLSEISFQSLMPSVSKSVLVSISVLQHVSLSASQSSMYSKVSSTSTIEAFSNSSIAQGSFASSVFTTGSLSVTKKLFSSSRPMASVPQTGSQSSRMSDHISFDMSESATFASSSLAVTNSKPSRLSQFLSHGGFSYISAFENSSIFASQKLSSLTRSTINPFVSVLQSADIMNSNASLSSTAIPSATKSVLPSISLLYTSLLSTLPSSKFSQVLSTNMSELISNPFSALNTVITGTLESSSSSVSAKQVSTHGNTVSESISPDASGRASLYANSSNLVFSRRPPSDSSSHLQFFNLITLTSGSSLISATQKAVSYSSKSSISPYVSFSKTSFQSSHAVKSVASANSIILDSSNFSASESRIGFQSIIDSSTLSESTLSSTPTFRGMSTIDFSSVVKVTNLSEISSTRVFHRSPIVTSQNSSSPSTSLISPYTSLSLSVQPSHSPKFTSSLTGSKSNYSSSAVFEKSALYVSSRISSSSIGLHSQYTSSKQNTALFSSVSSKTSPTAAFSVSASQAATVTISVTEIKATRSNASVSHVSSSLVPSPSFQGVSSKSFRPSPSKSVLLSTSLLHHDSSSASQSSSRSQFTSASKPIFRVNSTVKSSLSSIFQSGSLAAISTPLASRSSFVSSQSPVVSKITSSGVSGSASSSTPSSDPSSHILPARDSSNTSQFARFSSSSFRSASNRSSISQSQEISVSYSSDPTQSSTESKSLYSFNSSAVRSTLYASSSISVPSSKFPQLSTSFGQKNGVLLSAPDSSSLSPSSKHTVTLSLFVSNVKSLSTRGPTPASTISSALSISSDSVLPPVNISVSLPASSLFNGSLSTSQSFMHSQILSATSSEPIFRSSNTVLSSVSEIAFSQVRSGFLSFSISSRVSASHIGSQSIILSGITSSSVSHSLLSPNSLQYSTNGQVLSITSQLASLLSSLRFAVSTVSKSNFLSANVTSFSSSSSLVNASYSSSLSASSPSSTHIQVLSSSISEFDSHSLSSMNYFVSTVSNVSSLSSNVTSSRSSSSLVSASQVGFQSIKSGIVSSGAVFSISKSVNASQEASITDSFVSSPSIKSLSSNISSHVVFERAFQSSVTVRSLSVSKSLPMITPSPSTTSIGSGGISGFTSRFRSEQLRSLPSTPITTTVSVKSLRYSPINSTSGPFQSTYVISSVTESSGSMTYNLSQNLTMKPFRSASVFIGQISSFVTDSLATLSKAVTQSFTQRDSTLPGTASVISPLPRLSSSAIKGIVSAPAAGSSMTMEPHDISTAFKASSSASSSSVVSECFASACREDQICVSGEDVGTGNVNPFECRCPPGFFEGQNDNVCQRVDVLGSSIRIVEGNSSIFTAALEEKTSQEYQDLANEVTTTVNNVYQNSNLAPIYQGCVVVRFRNGSVIADLLLYFNSTNNDTLNTTASEVLNDGVIQQNNSAKLGRLIVDPQALLVEDRDECQDNSTNDCHSDAFCTNTVGSFQCFCKSGYTGNGRKCTDIDECKNSTLNNCKMAASETICLNLPGGYSCTSTVPSSTSSPSDLLSGTVSATVYRSLSLIGSHHTPVTIRASVSVPESSSHLTILSTDVSTIRRSFTTRPSASQSFITSINISSSFTKSKQRSASVIITLSSRSTTTLLPTTSLSSHPDQSKSSLSPVLHSVSSPRSVFLSAQQSTLIPIVSPSVSEMASIASSTSDYFATDHTVSKTYVSLGSTLSPTLSQGESMSKTDTSTLVISYYTSSHPKFSPAFSTSVPLTTTTSLSYSPAASQSSPHSQFVSTGFPGSASISFRSSVFSLDSFLSGSSTSASKFSTLNNTAGPNESNSASKSANQSAFFLNSSLTSVSVTAIHSSVQSVTDITPTSVSKITSISLRPLQSESRSSFEYLTLSHSLLGTIARSLIFLGSSTGIVSERSSMSSNVKRLASFSVTKVGTSFARKTSVSSSPSTSSSELVSQSIISSQLALAAARTSVSPSANRINSLSVSLLPSYSFRVSPSPSLNTSTLTDVHNETPSVNLSAFSSRGPSFRGSVTTTRNLRNSVSLAFTKTSFSVRTSSITSEYSTKLSSESTGFMDHESATVEKTTFFSSSDSKLVILRDSVSSVIAKRSSSFTRTTVSVSSSRLDRLLSSLSESLTLTQSLSSQTSYVSSLNTGVSSASWPSLNASVTLRPSESASESILSSVTNSALPFSAKSVTASLLTVVVGQLSSFSFARRTLVSASYSASILGKLSIALSPSASIFNSSSQYLLNSALGSHPTTVEESMYESSASETSQTLIISKYFTSFSEVNGKSASASFSASLASTLSFGYTSKSPYAPLSRGPSESVHESGSVIPSKFKVSIVGSQSASISQTLSVSTTESFNQSVLSQSTIFIGSKESTSSSSKITPLLSSSNNIFSSASARTSFIGSASRLNSTSGFESVSRSFQQSIVTLSSLILFTSLNKSDFISYTVKTSNSASISNVPSLSTRLSVIRSQTSFKSAVLRQSLSSSASESATRKVLFSVGLSTSVLTRIPSSTFTRSESELVSNSPSRSASSSSITPLTTTGDPTESLSTSDSPSTRSASRSALQFNNLPILSVLRSASDSASLSAVFPSDFSVSISTATPFSTALGPFIYKSVNMSTLGSSSHSGLILASLSDSSELMTSESILVGQSTLSSDQTPSFSQRTSSLTTLFTSTPLSESLPTTIVKSFSVIASQSRSRSVGPTRPASTSMSQSNALTSSGHASFMGNSQDGSSMASGFYSTTQSHLQTSIVTISTAESASHGITFFSSFLTSAVSSSSTSVSTNRFIISSSPESISSSGGKSTTSMTGISLSPRTSSTSSTRQSVSGKISSSASKSTEYTIFLSSSPLVSVLSSVLQSNSISDAATERTHLVVSTAILVTSPFPGSTVKIRVSTVTRVASSASSKSVISECFASACRDDEICVNGGELGEGQVRPYECRCRPGFYEGEDNNVCERADVLELRITIIGGNGSTYTPALEDKTTQEHRDLAKDITSAVNTVYKSSELASVYKGCEVVRFREGSVIADVLLYFNPTNNKTLADTAGNVINDSLVHQNNTGNLGGLTIDPQSLIVQDHNECKDAGSNDCDSNAICNNTLGSFQCVCKSGYTGVGKSCTVTNQCLAGTHNCHPNATCFSLSDFSFRCTCEEDNNYHGNGTHCFVGCSDNHCENGGTCIISNIGNICKCPAGSHGDRCEILVEATQLPRKDTDRDTLYLVAIVLAAVCGTLIILVIVFAICVYRKRKPYGSEESVLAVKPQRYRPSRSSVVLLEQIDEDFTLPERPLRAHPPQSSSFRAVSRGLEVANRAMQQLSNITEEQSPTVPKRRSNLEPVADNLAFDDLLENISSWEQLRASSES